ncbi:MAG: HAD-IC family P-type ATPase, partial [Patescibacteria group bacterium]
SQFKSPLIYILIISGFITLFLKEYTDSIVIFGSAILNTIVGFIQENKASNALKKIKKIAQTTALVLRDGNPKVIDAKELVPGDIIILNAGDKIPADGRIIESHDLKINEMTLTGEWLAAEKSIDVLKESTPLADRDNLVYMGTVIENGKAKVIVTNTGIETEIGKITKIVKETKEEDTPYQKKIGDFSRILGLVIVFSAVAIFVEGALKGRDVLEIFITAIAVAVASIPEGLPVSLTAILAIGMQQILKKGGLIRKLAAAETLGSTSIIATDKTGTLTEGKMKVVGLITAEDVLFKDKKSSTDLLLKISTLCNEAFIENPKAKKEDLIIRGRPTDQAMLLVGLENGLNKKSLRKEYEEIDEIAFNSINKYSAYLFKHTNRHVLYVCGAPEKIFELSTKADGGTLTAKRKEALEEELKKLTSKGLRVMAASYKDVKSKEVSNVEALLNNLTFVGFIAFKDPLRKDVKKAIKICRQAGVRPIIITGDHMLTAKAVAAELDLPNKPQNIIQGVELDALTEDEFQNIIKDIYVYARVEPRHKIRIIQAWQDRGEIVAMTGDGINDAPALKKADIGIALGSGTDVAKEVSDLILLDNSFSTIISAIEEGRKILDNMRKVITYLLTDSFTEVILVGTSVILGLPLPISAVQILWVNLIEDGLPDIALAFEPKEKDVMRQKPRGSNFPLLTKEMKTLIFIIGIITDIILVGLFIWLWQQTGNILYTRTMVFAVLTLDSLFFVFSCKSLRKNIWDINIFSNKFLILSFVIGVMMLFSAIYFPPFQILLKTQALDVSDWIIVLTISLIELVLIEFTKHHYIIKKQAV